MFNCDFLIFDGYARLRAYFLCFGKSLAAVRRNVASANFIFFVRSNQACAVKNMWNDCDFWPLKLSQVFLSTIDKNKQNPGNNRCKMKFFVACPNGKIECDNIFLLAPCVIDWRKTSECRCLFYFFVGEKVTQKLIFDIRANYLAQRADR